MVVNRKYIIKQLNKATPSGCSWSIKVKGADEQFDPVYYKISKDTIFAYGAITWRKIGKKKSHTRLKRNKYDDIVLHEGRPFGGEVGGYGTRFYPTYICDVIQTISTPNWIENAPEDLFKGIENDLDRILEECRDSKPVEVVRSKSVKLYDINEEIK